ncbi:MAG: iron transporter [Eubacterium sp.]|nr:iron transporter [Eubacterium sp.]
MKKKMLATALVTAMVASFALTGCGNSSTNTASSDQGATTETTQDASAENADEAAAPGEDGAAGFQEYPIFEDQKVEFINLSAVYFQPVPMSNGNEDIDDFNIHLEADISALENDLGYELGSWVPYLTVKYEVIGSDGSSAAKGTFMTMSASDGPHYGANIKLDKADTYSLKISIGSPEDNGYLVHLDDTTGPGGTFDKYFKDGDLEYTFEGWEYTPQEW